MVDLRVRAMPAFLATEEGFRVLTDAMPQMVWSTLPDGYHDYYNAQWYAFTGVPEGSTDGEAWNGMFHPEDQPRAWKAWRHALATGEPYEIEYRLRRHDGMYRWTLGRALPVREDGVIVRWIGTCTDIHEAKIAAEQNEVLNRELSHRIKNIFAVIAGLIELTKRSNPEHRPVLRQLVDRVLALSRAHNFARPHSDVSRPELPNSQLHGLLVELLAPYQLDDRDRVEIRSDVIKLDDRGATPVALIIHELATNAAKYGALRDESGRVTVTSTLDGGTVTIVWCERGGPEITGEPGEHGFGSQLLAMSAERQLAGTLRREWDREGLRVTITVPHANLHRGETAAQA
ncbi:MAG TPA: PAS domain-containing protein [Croceibacterium sp.]|nr:PAS domain-containing protein [Croceibacterium sp.]